MRTYNNRTLLAVIIRYVVATVVAAATALLLGMAGIIVAAIYVPFPLVWALGGMGGAMLALLLTACIYGLGRTDGYAIGRADGVRDRDEALEDAAAAGAAAADVALAAVKDAVADVADAAGDVAVADGPASPQVEAVARQLRAAVPARGGKRLVKVSHGRRSADLSPTGGPAR